LRASGDRDAVRPDKETGAPMLYPVEDFLQVLKVNLVAPTYWALVFHGVRCVVVHPGFTDTPMVRVLGDEYIQQRILSQTQLRRLIRPEEIAAAICFMISDSAMSGDLRVDAG
jgi:hypothetical protein